MSAVHRDPVYVRNSRMVRRVLQKRIDAGELVPCVNCGSAVVAEQRWDVGHIVRPADGGSHDLDNLGASHTGCNRKDGGRIGAAMTNRSSRKARRLPSWWMS